jgi:hypothetical protein
MKSPEDQDFEKILRTESIRILGANSNGGSSDFKIAGAVLAFSLAALRFADVAERIATALEKESSST